MRNSTEIFFWAILIFLFPAILLAQSNTEVVTNAVVESPAPASAAQTAPEPPALPLESQKPLSDEFVRQGWEASGKNELDKVIKLTNECVQEFGEEAQKLESQLNGFPIRGQEKGYQSLNDVATCLFIQAEALMSNGQGEEAQAVFQKVIDNYRWAQAWDPSRGTFWSVAEKSKDSIDVLTGARSEEIEVENPKLLKTVVHLHSKGKKDVIDYRRYGQFAAVGTKDYAYRIHDPQGLSQALGEGIYPNTSGVTNDPNYKKVKDQGRLEGSHWDFVNSEDREAAFYKWATAPEPQGVKLYYTASILEKAKMTYEAIKAYHALVVHFPRTVGWTYWHTPWYPAQAAIARIKYLIRQHPELNLKYDYAKIRVINGFDNDINNDVVITYPGVIEKKNFIDWLRKKFKMDTAPLRLTKMTRQLGEGEVRLVQYDNQHWQLLVKGQPYLIKGLTYAPTKVGQSPDKGTLVSWMEMDTNKNGILDGPYESWVDKNRNNQQDPDEPVVGDFPLMKEMGVNTLRIYHQPFEPKKEVLREMFKKFGFRVLMGDFLGKYTFGSGASWYQGTDYENPEHRKNMMEAVRKMVMEYKDEPYILMWILGNENNYGVASNADQKPAAYYQFVNAVALMIKSIDKNHPVAVCNGDTLFLDIFAKNAPDVDIFSANVYRGGDGFGSFWEQVKDATGKPAFISEYGAPAYVKHLSLKEGEEAQADYDEGNWDDIENNLAGNPQGAGNALGGIIFEWTDEWWKNYEPFFHDKKSDAVGPFPGGYYYEEWFGLTAQGNGKHSPFMRQLRTSYERYKKMWRMTQ